MTWPDLPGWLKISSTHFLAIALVAAALLFVPARALDTVGVTEFVDKYRMWIGFIFLASIAILFSRGAANLASHGKKRLRWRQSLKRGKRRLGRLTRVEATALAGYMREETRTQYFRYADGVIRGLEAERIIYRASQIAAEGDLFPYNIQPRALEYLTEHPGVLAEANNQYE